MVRTSTGILIKRKKSYLSNNVNNVAWNLKMEIAHENYILRILNGKETGKTKICHGNAETTWKQNLLPQKI